MGQTIRAQTDDPDVIAEVDRIVARTRAARADLLDAAEQLWATGAKATARDLSLRRAEIRLLCRRAWAPELTLVPKAQETRR